LATIIILSEIVLTCSHTYMYIVSDLTSHWCAISQDPYSLLAKANSLKEL